MSHNRTAFYETVFVYFLDWRRRSGEVDIPGDLLNDLPFEDEEILKLTLDEAQVRTNFPGDMVVRTYESWGEFF